MPAVSAPVRFRSILFDRPDHAGDPGELAEPAFFTDLNLDQVVAAMTAGRQDYDLAPFFYTPLHDPSAVGYRHEVLRDLEQPLLLAAVERFAEQMRRMRQHLTQADELRYPYQKERWFLDAVGVYCDAVAALSDDLAGLEVGSRGFRALRDHLSGYVASEGFRSLVAEVHAVREALTRIRYSAHVRGPRVTVSGYDGQADYSAEVERTFARFRQHAVTDRRARLNSWPEMNHVEAQILDRVARLFPDAFGSLDAFCARHRDYLDPVIGTFDREVQFYLAYRAYIRRLEATGLPFCYPEVSTESREIHATDAFDLALAANVPQGASVVCNDIHLSGPERIIVVTGPNQGGKTTFARMFGQLHWLASLGLPVPARSARLFLPDRVFAHFEREERLETLRGKLEDELVRVHDILAHATGDSVIVMNESFTSTTLHDALFLGTQVLRRVIRRGCLAVYVTFVDELASLGEATVSMVATIVPSVPEEPPQRTYKVVRKPADGLAYAAALADSYGLTYAALTERIGR